MKISLIGVPGAGKTTLAKIMSNMFNVMTISSGALARAHGFAGSDAEKTGQLDPDESKIQRLVEEAIGNSTHYILDGYPRTISQIASINIEIDAVLHLYVSDHNIGINRLLDRGRPDDTYDIIMSRMGVYQTQTAPLLEFYHKAHKLLLIDASDTIGYTLGQAVTQLSNFGIMDADNLLKRLMK